MTYSIRLLFLTFLSAPNGAKINYEHSHEGPLTMAIPLIILAIMSIIFGYYARDFFVGLGSSSLAHSLFVHPNHIISVEAEFAVPTIFKLLPVVASVLVGLTVLAIYQLAPSLLVSITKTKTGASIYAFFNQRYWVELIVNKFIVLKGLSLGYVFNKQLDRGAIELIGPHGVVTGLSSVSGLISKLDTGIITNYALYILLGLISFISLVFFAPIDPQGESIKAAQYSQLFILYIFALTAF